jgi:hypothetical protein
MKSAYEDLLPTLHTIGAQVEALERAIITDPPEEPPKLPSTEQVLRQVARAQLFGSAAVRGDLPRLLSALRSLRVLVGSLDQHRDWAGWGAPANLVDTINDLRAKVSAGKQDVFDLIDRLEAQMRRDLGDDQDSHEAGATAQEPP